MGVIFNIFDTEQFVNHDPPLHPLCTAREVNRVETDPGYSPDEQEVPAQISPPPTTDWSPSHPRPSRPAQ